MTPRRAPKAETRPLASRKGFLFTATTVLILTAVLLLTVAQTARTPDATTTTLPVTEAIRMSYIYDDVLSNAYRDLLSLESVRVSQAHPVEITINHTGLGSSPFTTAASEYSAFITGQYAVLNNIQLDITGLDNTISITPYNSTITIENETITVTTTDPSYIESISVQIKADLTNTSQGAPPDTGSVAMDVTIDHDAGRFYGSADLNPDSNNQPFTVESGNTSVEASFGRQGTESGVLTVATDGAPVESTTIIIRYTQTGNTTKVLGADMNLHLPMTNMTMRRQAVLASSS